MLAKAKKYSFLFEELVKRDFKKKYKRTALGMIWSLLAPLLNVFVIMIIFSHLFGRTQEHFIIYIFSGTVVMSFYTECTNGCMRALMSNASVFTKINVPKYLFILSKAVQSFINFLLTLVLYFIFCLCDGIHFGPHMLMLFYPILLCFIFNLGVGMILSALFVFFRDIEYLYGIFLLLLNYVSAIFYPISIIPEQYQKLFYMNPVYAFLSYFRIIVIHEMVPGWSIHLLLAFYAFVVLGIGCLLYKKFNHEFLYYV